MGINAHRTGFVEVPHDRRLVLSRKHLTGSDLSGLDLMQFSAEGCRFEGCQFDGTSIQSASFGSGRSMTVYIDCSFNGAHLRMGPGGYARFERCTFEDANIAGWFCYAVEVVACTFSGRIKNSVFNGTVPRERQDIAGRIRNEFVDNDFSRAELIDVGFRTGIDLSRQRLPSRDGYTYLPDGAEAVRRARRAMDEWTDLEAIEQATGVLLGMERDVRAGQRQLLVRDSDYPERSRLAIRSLLSAARRD